VKKITYWRAECFPNDAYSIRERTKKQVLEELKTRTPCEYGKPMKVTVSYKNIIDLIQICSGESGLYYAEKPTQGKNID